MSTCADCYWHHHWARCPHRKYAEDRLRRTIRDAQRQLSEMEAEDKRWAENPCRCVGLIFINARCPVPEHAERAQGLIDERAKAAS